MSALRRLFLAPLILLGCGPDGPFGSSLAEPTFEGIAVAVYENSLGQHVVVVDADTTDGDQLESLAEIGGNRLSPVILWSSGIPARWEDIRVGDSVSIWANGATRSLPPILFASRVILRAR